MNDKDLSIIKKSWYKIGIILKYNYMVYDNDIDGYIRHRIK